jgi:hypothetical protein
MAGRKIGEEADEYEARRAEMDEDVWLKGFKEGETKVRPWPKKVGSWVSYREHYDPNVKRFYPCCEEADCIGCTSEYERIRNRPRKWIMPAIDAEGRLQYFKMGARTYRKFKSREQRDPEGGLSGRDWLVVRTGTGFNDTEYDVDPGEKYKFKFKDVEGEPLTNDELMLVLGQKYDDFVADSLGEDREDDVDKWDEPEEKKPAKKTAAKASERITPPKKAESPKDVAKTSTRRVGESNGGDPDADSQDASDDDEDLGKDPSDEDIEGAPTSVIKRWLAAREVPVPTRTTRAQIVKLAKEYVPF